MPLPLKELPDYTGYGAFRFDSVDINGVGLNFELSKGEFNVNGFVRLLAEAEVRASDISTSDISIYMSTNLLVVF